MLEHCELVNIRVTEFGAHRLTSGEPVAANVSSDTSYAVEDSAFANRYLWTVEFVDEEQTPVAELTATILVEYDVSKGFVPDKGAAESIAQTTGYFAAYPYVRELFQTNASRLQLNPLVLGMLMRDATHPRTVTSP